MSVDAHPALDDAQLDVLRAALLRLRLSLDSTPDGYKSAWRRTAMREVVGDEPDEGDALPGYALSPRKTRGATRA